MLNKIWKWVVAGLMACVGVYYIDSSNDSEETEDKDDNGFFFFHF